MFKILSLMLSFKRKPITNFVLRELH